MTKTVLRITNKNPMSTNFSKSKIIYNILDALYKVWNKFKIQINFSCISSPFLLIAF